MHSLHRGYLYTLLPTGRENTRFVCLTAFLTLCSNVLQSIVLFLTKISASLRLFGRIVAILPPPKYTRKPETNDENWLPESVMANTSAAVQTMKSSAASCIKEFILVLVA